MQIQLAGRNFDAGYKSDMARDQLPLTAAYRMFDWIPQLGAPLRRRGGWTYATSDLNVVSACTRLQALAWAPFQNDPHLVCVADNGKVFLDRLVPGTASSYVGTTSFSSITQRPIWFQDLNSLAGGLVILSGGNSPAAPQKYTYVAGNYAVAALAGSPPNANTGAAYGDWLLLANGTVGGIRYANRIWASTLTAPLGEVWSPSTGFFDLPEEVVRVVPLRSMILVFGYRAIWMLTGDTPPPGGNWTKIDAYAIGTMDGRSVVRYRDTVVFANNAGVFQTDGSTITDLTDQGGISQHWQELVSNFNFSTGWSAAAGIYEGNYVIAVYTAAGTLVTCQVCDIEKRVWFEFTNLPAVMFAERQSGPGTATADGHEELFFAHRSLPRAGEVSPCWGTAIGPDAVRDADTTPVEPIVELPFYKLGSTGLKQIRNVWITHDLRVVTESSYARMTGAFATYAAATAAVPTYNDLVHWWDSATVFSPTFRIEAVLTPRAGDDYITLGELVATLKEQRRAVWVRKRALGIGLKISQINPSSDAILAEIEFESRPLTTVRRG